MSADYKDTESDLLRDYLVETDITTITNLWTNVPIGSGKTVPGLPEPFQQMAKELSRLRADAVVQRSDRHELVELKTRIRSTGVGQLNLYKLLNSPEVDIPPDTYLVLTARRIHPDVQDALTQLGIIVHVIPRQDSSTLLA